MAEYPALPLFTDAFISDTIHLNAEQTGAYLMLLMVAWRSPDCALPDDDILLARFSRMEKRKWMAHKDVIMSFWTKRDDGKYIQKRLVDERNFADAKRDSAIQAGRASALKRKERHSTTVATERQREGNHPTPTYKKDITNVISKKNTPLKKPDDVSQNVWDGFLIQRKAKKSPVTKLVLAGIRREAEKAGWSMDAALQEICLRGWQGFKAEWVQQTKGISHGKKYTSDDALREVLAEIEADYAPGPPVFCDAGKIRENAGRIENFDEGNDRGFAGLSPPRN